MKRKIANITKQIEELKVKIKVLNGQKMMLLQKELWDKYKDTDIFNKENVEEEFEEVFSYFMNEYSYYLLYEKYEHIEDKFEKGVLIAQDILKIENKFVCIRLYLDKWGWGIVPPSLEVIKFVVDNKEQFECYYKYALPGISLRFNVRNAELYNILKSISDKPSNLRVCPKDMFDKEFKRFLKTAENDYIENMEYPYSYSDGYEIDKAKERNIDTFYAFVNSIADLIKLAKTKKHMRLVQKLILKRKKLVMKWPGLLKEEVANAPQEFTDEYTLPKNWDACFKERL